jgi:hypothetical protein
MLKAHMSLQCSVMHELIQRHHYISARARTGAILPSCMVTVEVRVNCSSSSQRGKIKLLSLKLVIGYYRASFQSKIRPSASRIHAEPFRGSKYQKSKKRSVNVALVGVLSIVLFC